MCSPAAPPPFDSPGEWRSGRERFWSGLHEGPRFADLPDDLLANAPHLRDAREIRLWIGAGLSDQLMAPWLIRLCQLLGAELSKLSPIQFPLDFHPATPVVSLGVLPPESLRRHPAPEPMPPAAISEAKRVWAAVTASEPGPLLACLADGPTVLPCSARP